MKCPGVSCSFVPLLNEYIPIGSRASSIEYLSGN